MALGDTSKALTGSANNFETCWVFCGFSFSPQMSLDEKQPLHKKEVQSRGQNGSQELSTPALALIPSLMLAHPSNST